MDQILTRQIAGYIIRCHSKQTPPTMDGLLLYKKRSDAVKNKIPDFSDWTVPVDQNVLDKLWKHHQAYVARHDPKKFRMDTVVLCGVYDYLDKKE